MVFALGANRPAGTILVMFPVVKVCLGATFRAHPVFLCGAAGEPSADDVRRREPRRARPGAMITFSKFVAANASLSIHPSSVILLRIHAREWARGPVTGGPMPRLHSKSQRQAWLLLRGAL